MMFQYINDVNGGLLIDSLSINLYTEVRMLEAKKEVETEDLVSANWATEYPSRGSKLLSFTPIMGSVIPVKKAFSDNQPTILSYANQIFEGSRPLSELEEMVLTQTINRLAKREPSRAYRR